MIALVAVAVSILLFLYCYCSKKCKTNQPTTHKKNQKNVEMQQLSPKLRNQNETAFREDGRPTESTVMNNLDSCYGGTSTQAPA